MSTKSPIPSNPCTDAMLNVVKATRLLYCFTLRIKTTITHIHQCFSGYKYHYTVPYPLHDKTVWPVYDKTDAVFSAVWRRTFLPARKNIHNRLEPRPNWYDWKEDSLSQNGSVPVCHLLEIVVISDRGWDYTKKGNLKNEPEVSLNHTPILIMRVYRWLGGTSIDAWDLLKRYFNEFLFAVSKAKITSSDNKVDVYSQSFDLCELQQENDIKIAVQAFINNAEDQLKIKL